MVIQICVGMPINIVAIFTKADFEYRYITTHAKEKPLLHTFAILPLYQKKNSLTKLPS